MNFSTVEEKASVSPISRNEASRKGAHLLCSQRRREPHERQEAQQHLKKVHQQPNRDTAHDHVELANSQTNEGRKEKCVIFAT